MSDLNIKAEIAKRLQKLAQERDISVSSLLEELLVDYNSTAKLPEISTNEFVETVVHELGQRKNSA